MEDLVLSCLESRVEANRNIYARFLVGPFLKGDALTVATALRRVLLSSVESIGITALYIQGITHEFSTIAGVRESVLELSLNFQAIVLCYDKTFFQKKNFFEDIQIGYLQVQGPKIVYANDLKLPLGVKLVDPTQYIATVSKEGSIVLKFIIGKKNNLLRAPSFRTPSFSNSSTGFSKCCLPLHSAQRPSAVLCKSSVPCACFANRRLARSLLCPVRALSCNAKQRMCLILLRKTKKIDKAKRGNAKAKKKIYIGNKGLEKTGQQNKFFHSPKSNFEKQSIYFPILEEIVKKNIIKAKKRYSYKNSSTINYFRTRTWFANLFCHSPFLLCFAYKSSICKQIKDLHRMCPTGKAPSVPCPYGATPVPQCPSACARTCKGQGVRGKKPGQSTEDLQSTENLQSTEDLHGFCYTKFKSFASYKEIDKKICLPCPCKSKICKHSAQARRGTVKSRIPPSSHVLANQRFAQRHSESHSFLEPLGNPLLKTKGKRIRIGRLFALALPLHFAYKSKICKHSARAQRDFALQNEPNQNGQKNEFFLAPSYPFLPLRSTARHGGQITKNNRGSTFLSKNKVFKSDICLRNIIPLDLTLTPVLKVNFSIEMDDEVLYLHQKIRERIILEVWTNGSVHPRQAVHDAALSLTDMFASFRSVYDVKSYFLPFFKVNQFNKTFQNGSSSFLPNFGFSRTDSCRTNLLCKSSLFCVAKQSKEKPNLATLLCGTRTLPSASVPQWPSGPVSFRSKGQGGRGLQIFDLHGQEHEKIRTEDFLTSVRSSILRNAKQKRFAKELRANLELASVCSAVSCRDVPRLPTALGKINGKTKQEITRRLKYTYVQRQKDLSTRTCFSAPLLAPTCRANLLCFTRRAQKISKTIGAYKSSICKQSKQSTAKQIVNKNKKVESNKNHGVRFTNSLFQKKINDNFIYKTKLERNSLFFSDLGELALPVNIYCFLKQKGIEKFSTLKNFSSFDLLLLLEGNTEMFYIIKRFIFKNNFFFSEKPSF